MPDLKNLNYEIQNVYGEGHTPYYVNMIDSSDGKAEAICDGKEGLKSLEIICAAYKSQRKKDY